jgi:hypothetical protein
VIRGKGLLCCFRQQQYDRISESNSREGIMGFESFRVELRGGRATHFEINETVREPPHVRLDPEAALMPGSTCYLRNDGRHAIELQLSDAPVRLSCRFTLCHPSSVDSVFLGFLRELMARLGMEVTICDDVRPEHSGSFSLREFAEFSAIITDYIAARRAEWMAAFGPTTLPATTPEVYQRIILPRCQPGIGQPT